MDWPNVAFPYVFLGQSGSDNQFYGWLSEVRFYKEALPASEVYAVRSYTGATQPVTNNKFSTLLAYYPFSSSNMYNDASGNGYTLTSTNGASYAPAYETATGGEPYPNAGAVYFSNAGTGFAGVAPSTGTTRSFTVTVGSGWNLLNMIGTSAIPSFGFSFCAWVKGADGATAGTLNTINAKGVFTFFSTYATTAAHFLRVITTSTGNSMASYNFVTPASTRTNIGGGL
jgi:hypothetical protein